MIKLRPRKFLSRSNSKGSNNGGNKSFKGTDKENVVANNSEIKWEVRPGGMLVQKRETGQKPGEGMMISIKVSTASKWHDISIEATSTFGDLKKLLSIVTGLHPREQRILYKGKEREDHEHLHMLGVGDKEKVLMLEDPAFKDKKLRSLLGGNQPFGAPYRTITV